MATLDQHIKQFAHYFWQHYRFKLLTLAVITVLVGILYYVGMTNEKSYLWVNVISEDLNLP